MQATENADRLQKALHFFSCSKNVDTVEYLQKKALQHEEVSLSRTYIYLDEDFLDKDEWMIHAYFTVSLKSLYLETESRKIGRKTRRALHGISTSVKEIPVYLIGQLGKADGASIAGSEILTDAVNIINEAHWAVGGRCVLIECEDREKLLDFYNYPAHKGKKITGAMTGVLLNCF